VASRWDVFSDALLPGSRLCDIDGSAIGLYAIYIDDVLVYIGMSQYGIGARLFCHLHPAPRPIRDRYKPRALGSGTLDGFFERDRIVVKVRSGIPFEWIPRAEARLLRRLQPPCNSVLCLGPLPGPRPPSPIGWRLRRRR
jgi:hypothetical protein